MSTFVDEKPTQNLEAFKGVKKVPHEEYYTSGHRTCQGCESAQIMKLMAKKACRSQDHCSGQHWLHVRGEHLRPRHALGCAVDAHPTGQLRLGRAGAAAALRVQMRKGAMKDEPINVIAFCGDGGGADMGLGAISATMCHPDYNLLILMYDNESYANTDIQISGTSPYGVNTSFSTPGKVKRIMNHRWKKNMAPLMMVGHPTVKYVGTISTSYPLQAMNSVRKALSIGGTDLHSLPEPLPQGLGSDPVLSFELGELAVNTGIWPLDEIECGKLRLYGKTEQIANGRFKRLPVRDYLLKQGRFAHFIDEDIEYFQSKIDDMWNKWLVPGIIPLQKRARR